MIKEEEIIFADVKSAYTPRIILRIKLLISYSEIFKYEYSLQLLWKNIRENSATRELIIKDDTHLDHLEYELEKKWNVYQLLLENVVVGENTEQYRIIKVNFKYINFDLMINDMFKNAIKCLDKKGEKK